MNSAFEVRQDLYWVLNSAFLLRAKDNDWLGALEILQAGINKNITPLKKAKRLKAIALYELSKDALAEKDETKFFKFINQALAENNKLLPAAIDLANYYKNHDKQTRKAQQVLYNIWCVNPTYEIAQAYLNLYPKDSKINKIQRMEKLALYNKLRPSLNNIILAELYLDAKKYSNATSECKMFLLKNPATQKINEILNVLAKKSRKKSKDNELLDANIENYPADFQWACANCGHLSSKWEAICPECNEIGRNYWHLYIDNNKK